MKILIFGLSSAGKSYLASRLHEILEYPRLNGDDVRKKFDDWDFSIEGRIRQAHRINELANDLDISIIDFIAPLKEMRDIINADYTIFMDTITSSQYEDTDKLFEYPNLDDVDYWITSFDYDVEWLAEDIASLYNQSP